MVAQPIPGLEGYEPDWSQAASAAVDLRTHAQRVAKQRGVPEDVLLGVLGHESGLDPKAYGNGGGVGQFIESTARSYGTTQAELRANPRKAVELAAQLLRDNADQFGGDFDKAAAAYFIGPGNIETASRQGGGNWLQVADQLARQYNQGTVSGYLSSVHGGAGQSAGMGIPSDYSAPSGAITGGSVMRAMLGDVPGQERKSVSDMLGDAREQREQELERMTTVAPLPDVTGQTFGDLPQAPEDVALRSTGTLRSQLPGARDDYLTSNALPALGVGLTAGVGLPLLAGDAMGAAGVGKLASDAIARPSVLEPEPPAPVPPGIRPPNVGDAGLAMLGDQPTDQAPEPPAPPPGSVLGGRFGATFGYNPVGNVVGEQLGDSPVGGFFGEEFKHVPVPGDPDYEPQDRAELGSRFVPEGAPAGGAVARVLTAPPPVEPQRDRGLAQLGGLLPKPSPRMLLPPFVQAGIAGIQNAPDIWRAANRPFGGPIAQAGELLEEGGALGMKALARNQAMGSGGVPGADVGGRYSPMQAEAAGRLAGGSIIPQTPLDVALTAGGEVLPAARAISEGAPVIRTLGRATLGALVPGMEGRYDDLVRQASDRLLSVVPKGAREARQAYDKLRAAGFSDGDIAAAWGQSAIDLATGGAASAAARTAPLDLTSQAQQQAWRNEYERVLEDTGSEQMAQDAARRAAGAEAGASTRLRNTAEQMGQRMTPPGAMGIVPEGTPRPARGRNAGDVAAAVRARAAERFREVGLTPPGEAAPLAKGEVPTVPGLPGRAPLHVRTAEDLAKLRVYLKEMIEEGVKAGGRFWYEISGEGFLRAAQGDVGRGTRLAAVAAMGSPQTAVKSQGNQIVRAIGQFLSGEKMAVHTATQNARMNKLADATDDELVDYVKQLLDPELTEAQKNALRAQGISTDRGRKTANFFLDLLDGVNPELAARIRKEATAAGLTVDMHMSRAFGYGVDEVPNDAYDFMESVTTDLARELSEASVKAGGQPWSPKQAQAAIFTSDILRDPSRWPDPAEAAMNYATALQRNRTILALKAAPGNGTPASAQMPFFEAWDYPHQLEYAADIEKMYLDDDGNHMLLAALGMPGTLIERAPGIWSPRVASAVPVDVYTHPNMAAKMDELAALVGYTSQKTQVPWMRLVHDVKGGAHNGVLVDMQRPMTADEAKALQQNLPGDYHVVQGPDNDIYVWREPTELDVAGRPKEVKVDDPRYLAMAEQNEGTRKRIQDTIDQVWDDAETPKLTPVAADGRAPVNDWTVSVNGEEFLGKAPSKDRPEVRQVLDLLRSRFQAINAKHRGRLPFPREAGAAPGAPVHDPGFDYTHLEPITGHVTRLWDFTTKQNLNQTRGAAWVDPQGQIWKVTAPRAKPGETVLNEHVDAIVGGRARSSLTVQREVMERGWARVVSGKDIDSPIRTLGVTSEGEDAARAAASSLVDSMPKSSYPTTELTVASKADESDYWKGTVTEWLAAGKPVSQPPPMGGMRGFPGGFPGGGRGFPGGFPGAMGIMPGGAPGAAGDTGGALSREADTLDAARRAPTNRDDDLTQLVRVAQGLGNPGGLLRRRITGEEEQPGMAVAPRKGGPVDDDETLRQMRASARVNREEVERAAKLEAAARARAQAPGPTAPTPPGGPRRGPTRPVAPGPPGGSVNRETARARNRAATEAAVRGVEASDQAARDAALEEARGMQRGGFGKEVVGALGLPRVLSLSSDFGTARDLGLFTGSPEALRAAGAGAKGAVRTAFSEPAARAAVDDAKGASRWFEFASTPGNLPGGRKFREYQFGRDVPADERVPEMSGLNESAISGVVERFHPGVRVSDRVMAVQRNLAGIHLLDKRLDEIALKYGVSGPADAASNPRFLSEAQSTIDTVNHLRGYSGGGKAQALSFLNFFTSPQQMISRLQVIGDPLSFAMRGDMESAKFAARNLAGFASSQAALMAALHLTGNQTGGRGAWSVNLNPTDSDFGTIRVGNTRYDTMAGLGPTMRLVAKIGAETSDQVFGTDYAKNQAELGQLVQKWLENKEQPTSRIVTDFMLHNKLPDEQTAIDMMAPSIASGFMESIREERGGLPERVARASAAAGANFAGVGTNTYQLPRDKANDLAADLYNGAAYNDLELPKQLNVLAHLPEEARRGQGNPVDLARERYTAALEDAGGGNVLRDATTERLYPGQSYDDLTPKQKDAVSSDAERAKKQAEIWRSQPELDFQRWYFGSQTGGSLHSAKAVEQALAAGIPDRDVKLEKLDRVFNSSPKMAEAWKAEGSRVANFLDDDYLVKKYAAGDTAQALRNDPDYRDKPIPRYENLPPEKQSKVLEYIRREVRSGSPKLDATLAYFGYGGSDKHYSVHSPAASTELSRLRNAYGRDPAKKDYKFWAAY